jgi:hypothetical protein
MAETCRRRIAHTLTDWTFHIPGDTIPLPSRTKLKKRNSENSGTILLAFPVGRGSPMTREKINGRRLVGLFLLGMLLFNFPVLYLFNRPELALGIPVLYLYLFGAWSLIIFLMLMVSRSRSDSPFPDHSE